MGILGLAESRLFRFAAALTGIVIPALWLLTLAGPPEEAVKIRNSILASIGSPEDFDWAPSNAPAEFLTNRGAIPENFQSIAAEIRKSSGAAASGDFELANAISKRLMGAPTQLGGAIQSDNATTYREITSEGRGYCADFTQVFNAIALALKLPVREWSISFSAFGAGHAFNEVFDARRGKWILVDSFHSLYFADPSTLQPLSVREVHDRLLGIGTRDELQIMKIVPSRFPFRTDSLAIDYYRRGMPQLALIAGNNVFDYEAAAPVRWASHLSRRAEQVAAIIVGVQPRMLIYPVGVSDRDVRELFRTRDRFVIALACLVAAVLIFGIQCAGLLLGTRHDRPNRKVGVDQDRP